MAKTPKVYAYYDRDKYIMTGTVREIAEKMNVSINSVHTWRRWRKCKRLELVGEYLAIYEVFSEGKMIARGTRKECADSVYLSVSSICSKACDSKAGRNVGVNGGYVVKMVGYEFREVKHEKSSGV